MRVPLPGAATLRHVTRVSSCGCQGRTTSSAGLHQSPPYQQLRGLREPQSDETIRDLAGHVSKEMLKHYSHIGMEAKRRAVAALAVKPAKANLNSPKSIQDPKESPKVGKVN